MNQENTNEPLTITFGAIGCSPMRKVDFGGYLIARVTRCLFFFL